jgi:hypothetical protein
MQKYIYEGAAKGGPNRHHINQQSTTKICSKHLSRKKKSSQINQQICHLLGMRFLQANPNS